ncbi:MAG: VTT domain-containing protein [Chloroflexi bacterium]|nr:VTT domain-containing protein [Chloroflexota bacterium]
MNPPPQSPAHRQPPALIFRILALLAVLALSIFIYTIRDRAEQLAIYGYPGIFLLAFLSYATVLLPAPGVAVVFTMGAVFNPLAVALAAGAGAALGEISGYLAGFSGQTVIQRAPLYNRLNDWMRKNGPLSVLLLSAVPNPFFDLAGVIAGALKMPLRSFLFFCWLGETLKMLFFAYVGAGVLGA